VGRVEGVKVRVNIDLSEILGSLKRD